MEATKLRGMPVVNIQNAEKLGEVRDILVDLSSQRLVALELKASSSSAGDTVPIESVYSIGKDAITLREGTSAHSSGQGGEREGVDASGTAGVVALKTLMGSKVLTYSGNLLGTVADLEFDPSTFQVVGYNFSTGGLADITGRHRKLQATPDVRFANGILMVPDDGQGSGEGRPGASESET